MHLGQSSTPLPAITSLQPLASPWRYQKTSGWNCSPTEAFAKPAGKDKATDSDKTYLLTRLHLLNKDEQQSISTRKVSPLQAEMLSPSIISWANTFFFKYRHHRSFTASFLQLTPPQFPFSQLSYYKLVKRSLCPCELGHLRGKAELQPNSLISGGAVWKHL